MELDNLMHEECKVKRTVAKDEASRNIIIEKALEWNPLRGKSKDGKRLKIVCSY